MNDQITLQGSKLSKEFDGIPILKQVNFNVSKGEIFAVIGANGAGKTTLLKLVAGLLEPTEGCAYVLGSNVWAQRATILKSVGSLIEVPYFYEHLSAHENLSIHLSYMETKADIGHALMQVGLDGVGNKPVSKFSLGMRQRLGIARSIIHKPKVLLLDEPINGLDPIAIREIRELLHSLKQEGMAIILSSHILSEVEHTADRIAILKNGTLTESFDIKKLKEQHGEQLEDYFIGIMKEGI